MKTMYSQRMKSMSGADDLAPTAAELEAELIADVLRDEITCGDLTASHSPPQSVKILKAPDDDLPF